VTVESTERFLRNYLVEYHAYIQRVYMAIPRGGWGGWGGWAVGRLRGNDVPWRDSGTIF